MKSLSPAACLLVLILTILAMSGPEAIAEETKEVPVPPNVEPTKNSEAADVVFSLLRLAIANSSVKKFEPLVVNTSRSQIRKFIAEVRTPSSSAAEAGLKTLVLRDARIGELVINNDGSEFLVEEKHLGPDQTYLVATQKGRDLRIIRLVRDDGTWKVDVAHIIDVAMPRVFEGITTGMTRERVEELLKQYRTTRKFKRYEITETGKDELEVICDSGDVTWRHALHFEGGILFSASTKAIDAKRERAPGDQK